jgi:hypothetical protein
MTATRGRPARRLETGTSWQDYRQAVEDYYARGWSDGLPVVPPTEAEVGAMVAASGRDGLEALGEIPPRRGLATIETVATCAVMAGCQPQYFPVVVAAIEALLEPAFNLNGLQSTGNGATPLCIVSGPVVDELRLNYGTNLFGYGFRANATIGRAIRLTLLIQGGAYPDTGTKSAMGSPARYSYCIAEAPSAPGNSLHNPWVSLHHDLGLSDVTSAVTMVGANAPVNIWAGHDFEHEGFLSALAEEMAKMAMVAEPYRPGAVVPSKTQLVLVINPYAAQRLAEDDGWDRRTFRDNIFQRAWDARARMAEALPITGRIDDWFPGPERIVTVVAGGAHFPTVCALMTGWLMGAAWATSRPVQRVEPAGVTRERGAPE